MSLEASDIRRGKHTFSSAIEADALHTAASFFCSCSSLHLLYSTTTISCAPPPRTPTFLHSSRTFRRAAAFTLSLSPLHATLNLKKCPNAQKLYFHCSSRMASSFDVVNVSRRWHTHIKPTSLVFWFFFCLCCFDIFPRVLLVLSYSHHQSSLVV